MWVQNPNEMEKNMDNLDPHEQYVLTIETKDR